MTPREPAQLPSRRVPKRRGFTVRSSDPMARGKTSARGGEATLFPNRRDGRGVDRYEVSYAEDETALAEQMGRLEGRCDVLPQEYYIGEAHGVELLAHEGRPLAAFQHRRLREVPITGGASSFRESVAVEPALFDHSARLLAALDWTGVAMVEFKVGREGRG